MGPADSRRISRAPRYSGYHYASATIRVRGCHPLRPAFPGRSTWLLSCDIVVLQPRDGLDRHGLGSSAFARHYSRNHLLFSPPMGTSMFQFPTFAPAMPVTGLQPAGLPHSEIHGSRDICSSPWLFAAYRVLRRLREPRHPPSALAYFLLAARLRAG